MTKKLEAKFLPRHYQSDIMRALFLEQKKRLIICAHRRSGKDSTAFQMLWMSAMMRVGLYFHLLPKITQSSGVIWHGRGKDGTSFLDYIPSQFIKKLNHSTMSIHLINGSVIKITGADNYEALIGTNPLGIVYSEIQSTDPRAWDYLRPVLAENDGFAIFIGTPRGHNHFYEMFQENKSNPSWYAVLLSAADTKRRDGTPVITQDIINEEIKGGMPREIVEQEFFCSWTAAILGAYFTEEMKAVRAKNQIRKVDLDPNLLVFTSWDLGISDSTVVTFYQATPSGDIHCIHHIEDQGKSLEYYIIKLVRIQAELGFKKYGFHFVPHDIKVRELGTGRTRFEIMQRAGLNLCIVPRTSIQERIQCARALLPKMHFDEKRCKHLIRCLDEYHEKRDEKRGVGTGPNHNWASHSVDALTYFAVGFLNEFDKGMLTRQMSYAKLRPLA